MIGKRYGKLTVIDFSHVIKGNSYWKCKCDCGNNKILPAHSLKSGNTSSCGCFKVYKHAQGETGFNILYGTYKMNSRNRGKKFDLSLEEFKKITSERCYYCGTEPISIAKTTWNIKDSKKLDHTVYRYNGIDRIDSSKGYEKNNIVPCCKWCNIAKANRTLADFKKHIFKIYVFLISKNQ